jgi:hypothetical protein
MLLPSLFVALVFLLFWNILFPLAHSTSLVSLTPKNSYSINLKEDKNKISELEEKVKALKAEKWHLSALAQFVLSCR